MPYPVSPPALPPVVNVVLPEESFHSSSNQDFAEAAALNSPTEASTGSFVPADTATCVENCGSVVPVLEPVSTAPSLTPAASLGGPVTINQPDRAVQFSVAPEPLPRATRAAQTVILPLPELDALVLANTAPIPRTQQYTAPDTLPAVPIGSPDSQLARMVPEPSSSAPQETDGRAPLPDAQLFDAQLRPEPTAVPQPSQQPETLRLDLPIPAPAPLEVDPDQPTTEPLPNPVPDSDGEVLTIPTPPQPTPEAQPNQPTPGASPGEGVPIDPQAVGEVLEVQSDRQEFDERQQIFIADGNVRVRFRQAILTADRVQVNIPNRVAVAEGNAVLTRGDQVLRGALFTYNFGLNQGAIQTARGELLIPAAERDFDPTPPAIGSAAEQPATERLSTTQPLQVFGGIPGPAFGLNLPRQQQGQISRLRFEADQVEFFGENLEAQNVRITNDPFSPPELELRSSRATYTRLSPTTAEIRARNPRLVFDQGFELPLLVDRLVLDNRRRSSGLFNFGFDERDRDGFFIERTFDVYSTPLVSFSLTPQILVQRAIDQGSFPDPDHFGLIANLDFRFSPNTTAQAVANFSSLDLSEIEDRLRASVRAQQRVFNHTVALEYSYRNRLFNGSLGFQDVQSSIGLVINSPRYVLGDSLINLNYQGSIQYVNAQTDQGDLYPQLRQDRDLSCIKPDDRDTTGNGCVDLTRYQVAATLSRFFPIWYGTPLPPTPTEGLRYTPTPVVPYLGVFTQLQGVYSGYSNGDTQASLRGSVTLLGQIGRFSRPFLDSTEFSFGYFNTLLEGKSPFLFDRVGDSQFVIAGLTQQIYGPLRAGVQIAYNLDTQDEIDTVYRLEYRRRTYSIIATYSSGRREATLSFQLNDFNWTGDPGPFSGSGGNMVESSVIQGVN
ncbi:MAG: DUF3769 domain-containing protein [Elainella sp. C42_A2020_010]|nr:DUF3769 domain-containing protein [Elainella sp. C42_A2020_010]